jgi:sulfate adenylyltransferase subunit 1 (EFTu-like GTPase family)
MGLIGDIERRARRYRLAGSARAGKTALEECLFGQLWIPSRQAAAAVVVVDVLRGVDARAHDAIAGFLDARVPHVIVAVNRMDLAGYEYEAFKSVRAAVAAAADDAHAGGVAVVPVSARLGDNVLERGARIDWYPGRTLAEFLGATLRETTHAG